MNKKGFSLIELLIVVAIILIIAAIAIPNLLRARIAANESSAVSNLRTLGTAEITYQATYNAGFSPNLTSLCPPAGGAQASATTADLVDAVMCGATMGPPANGGPLTFTKSGYVFTYTGAPGTFFVMTTPIAIGSSGQNAFCSDQTSVIHRNTTGASCVQADAPI